MDEHDYIPAQYDATCHTEGCDNAGITIRVPAHPVTPSVQCGPCGVKITDLVAVTEGGAL